MIESKSFYFGIILTVSIFLFSGQQNCLSQTYIIPEIGLAYNSVTLENKQYFVYSDLKNDIEESYSIGLRLIHKVSNNFVVNISTRWERLATAPENIEFFRDNERIEHIVEFPLRRFVHRRFHYSLGVQYNIFEQINISISSILISTPSILWQRAPEWRDLIPNTAIPAQEKEFGLEVGIGYQLNRFDLSFYYRHGIWQNDRGANGEVDPVNSLSLRLGYHFKVFDKVTRKNKVDCPKL